jgi:hypothetical protein
LLVKGCVPIRPIGKTLKTCTSKFRKLAFLVGHRGGKKSRDMKDIDTTEMKRRRRRWGDIGFTFGS